VKFVVEPFKEKDQSDFLKMSDLADSWPRENDRLDIPQSNWQQLLDGNTNMHGFVLRDTDTQQAAGYVMYSFRPCIRTVGDECAILDIFVREEYRNQGGGSLLREAVETEAAKNNAGCIRFNYNPNRPESSTFYANYPAEKIDRTLVVKWL
jgi:GNAT superfamily N-acetyltransferase